MIKTFAISTIVFFVFFFGIICARKLNDDQIKLAKYILALFVQAALLTITVLMTVVFLF